MVFDTFYDPQMVLDDRMASVVEAHRKVVELLRLVTVGFLAAAPRRVREGAAVIKWNAVYTYETLKEGTNRLVCRSRTAASSRC